MLKLILQRRRLVSVRRRLVSVKLRLKQRTLFVMVVLSLPVLKQLNFSLWLALMMLGEIVKSTRHSFGCSILTMLLMVLNLPSVLFVSY